MIFVSIITCTTDFGNIPMYMYAGACYACVGWTEER